MEALCGGEAFLSAGVTLLNLFLKAFGDMLRSQVREIAWRLTDLMQWFYTEYQLQW